MKILRLTTNYPAYLEQFKNRNPGIESLPYEEQSARLMAERFGWSDAWTHALAPLGAGMWEPVANFESAQRAWARSRGLTFEERNWLPEITSAQVKEYSPDVLLVDDYSTFSPALVEHLKEQTPSIRAVVYWCGSPLGDLSHIGPADLVLSNLPGLVDYLNRAGKTARLFRHAFDRRVLEELGAEATTCFALSFAGSIVRRANYHTKRAEILTVLARELDIAIFSETYIVPQPRNAHRGILQRLLSPLFEPLGYVLESKRTRGDTIEYACRRAVEQLPDELLAQVRPPVFGLEMYRVLRDSRITVNVHLDYFGESAANMRLFEATGVGCCLLTDWKYDLAAQFAQDSEVVTFRSAGECLEKARYLVAGPQRAAEIGQAAQRRTLREHTFEHRAPEFLEALKSAR